MDYGIRESLQNIQVRSYVGDHSSERKDLVNFIDCSSGINPYGCSPSVKERLKSVIWEDVNAYPESSLDIKQSIIDYWGSVSKLKECQIFLADGSMAAISKVNRLFLGQGSKILGYSPQFSDYIDDVKSYGGRYEYYLLNKKNNFKFDVKAFLDKMDSSHNLFYLDNPNNPTGQIIDIQSMEEILRKAKSLNKAVLIDEAYGDFMDRGQSAISLINSYENLFVSRTFSKGLGLAGLRAGYLITSKDLGKYYGLISNPYEMNTLARDFAIYTMKDTNFIKSSRRKIRSGKDKLVGSLKIFKPLETDLNTPIMTIKHPDDQVNFKKLLQDHGILAISTQGFIGLDKSYVRIRIPENIDGLIERLEGIERQIRDYY